MIFIYYGDKITDEKYTCGTIYYDALHPIHGVKKTTEELDGKGIFLNDLPELTYIEGKRHLMYVNPKTKEIFYEYEDLPKTKEEILLDRVKALEQSNAELMNLIMMQGMTPK